MRDPMYSCLDRLFRHLAWADQAILAVLDVPDRRLETAHKLLAHIVVAENIWLSRIHSRDIGDLTPWSPLPLPECQKLSATTLAGYLELIGTISEQRLQDPISYRSTKGDEYRTPLGDILLHVALHGSHHRGQIASLVRSCDLSVPMTDFILFSRQLPDGTGMG